MGDTRGTRVYVGNLTDKVKKDDLEDEFNKYGKLNSVWIALNPPGFAFVEFEHRDDAEKACDVLNGSERLGSQLRVEISKGRRDNYSRGSGGGGGFRPRGSSNGRYYDRGYGSGGGRSSGGYSSRDGGDRSNSFSRRDVYGSSSDRARESGGSGSYSGGGRSSGSGGGRFRSRSPSGSHRF